MATGRPMELPAYIQLRYQENGVFSKLENQVANVTGIVRRDFEEMSGTVQNALARAVTMPRTSGGSLDLGVDQMREALRAQQTLASAFEETARAARRASDADGGRSAALLRTAEAAEALAVKERQAADAALVHLDVIDRVQAELSQEASAIDAVIGSQRRLAGANDNGVRSAGAHRAAMMNLGAQMQDTVIQAQMGTSALTIFTQQGSQAAYAMAGLGGRIGAVATVMSGPLGAAFFATTALAGPFIMRLFQTAEAAKAAEIGSSGLSDAQSVLGGMFDLTSGRIQHQNELLVMNARLTAMNLRAEASAQRTSADKVRGFSRGMLSGIGFGDMATNLALGNYGGNGVAALNAGQAAALLEMSKSGQVTREDALRRSEKLDFTGLSITKQDFQQALIDEVSAEFKERTAKLIDESLDSGTLAKDLRRDSKPKKDNSAEKAAREAEQLRKAGEAAAETVARINERFDESPKLIDQAAQATRALDDIISDMDRKLAKKGLAKNLSEAFQQARKDAVAAKSVVEDALLRPLEDMRKASERRLRLQDLIVQGHDIEAAALQNVWAIEDKLGSEEQLRAKVQALITAGRKEEAAAFEQLLAKYPQMKREAAELAEQEAQRTREAERQKALFDAQLNVIQTARTGLTDLLSGRKTDLFGDIKQSLKDLHGARLADQLFGDAFKEIEDQLRQRTPLGKATSRLTDSVDTAGAKLEDLATAVEGAAKRIAAAGTETGDPSLIDGNEIAVTGKRGGEKTDEKPEVTIAKPSIVEMANKTAGAMVEPFQASMNKLFGTEFGQMLGGTITGAIGGSLAGGTAGGILGGLKGVVDQTGIFGGSTGGLSGRLGMGLDGAATGSMAAGIMKGLGLKTSSTGAQIGGAIGGLTGIPGGDIIGSIAGGILGGLFKTNRTAGVVLTGNNDGVVGGKDKGNYATATGLGGSVLENLNGIVDKLGGEIGNFMVTIGTRGDEYRVNPNGTSLKIKNGAISFGDDAEAAIAYAVKNAIEDGALKGMRASTLNILKAGKDLEAALTDALDWENVFKELRKYKDPLGAAMDDLDDEFERYIEIAKTAGASAQEMADLQELYGIKQAEAIDSFKDSVLGSLQGLMDDLTVGDNGLSLRDRRNAALGTYDDLAARVSSGDKTAYDDYAEAAKTLLDIERELYGSQSEYFDRLNEITDLTKTRIDAESNVISINENRDSPFDASGAVKSAITSQTDMQQSQLSAVNENLGRVLSTLNQIAANGSVSTSAAARLVFSSSF